MPDNTVIGELAAKYLVRRGHRRLAYLGVGKGVWSLGVRSLSFARTASDAGAAVQLLEAADERAGADLWAGDGIAGAAQVLVHQLLQTAPRPTGLFVAEDRLLAAVVAALAGHGLVAGPGADVEIISCNNERPHLIGLAAPPATIDIRAEAIGRRGVEQLLWRMRNPGLQERIRTMVEPLIVEPGRPAQVVTNNR
jgi:LacI family transcriptional regulator